MSNDAEYERAVAAALDAQRLGQKKTTKTRFTIVSVVTPFAAIRRRRAERAEKARGTIVSDGDLMSFDPVKPKKLTRKQQRAAKKEQARLNARATPVGKWRSRGVTSQNTGNALLQPHTPQDMEPQRISSQEVDAETKSQMNFWANLAAPDLTPTQPFVPFSPHNVRDNADPFAQLARRESKSPVCGGASSTSSSTSSSFATSGQQLNPNTGEWTWVSPAKTDQTSTVYGGSFLDLKLDMSPGEGTPTQIMADVTNTRATTSAVQNPFDMFEIIPTPGGLYASAVC